MNQHTIGVVFKNTYSNGQTYHYKWHSDLPQGTLAVVYANGEYKVVSVVSSSPTHKETATKWLVDVISTDVYHQREMAEAREKEIRKQLRERASKLSDISFYETLAKNDTKMAELLSELREVSDFNGRG